MSVLLMLLLFSLRSLRGQSNTGTLKDASQLLNVSCTNDTLCMKVHFAAKCNITQYNSTVPPGGQCYCNGAAGFYRQRDVCVYHSAVSETCDIKGLSSICIDGNSRCEPDSQGTTGMSRCVCIAGTVLVRHNGTQHCAYPITMSDDGACELCDFHRGTCFALQTDRKRDGCACPPSFSGVNCEKVHVNVSCSIYEMQVCYEPHPTVNLTYGLRMQSDGKQDQLSCRAVQSPTLCGPGKYGLVLPLREALLSVCGTQVKWETNRIRYTNTIRVQLDRHYASSEDIVFTTFCSFVSMHDLTFVGMKVDSYTGTEIGQDVRPVLSLAVRDHLGQYLREGVYYRVGDIVHINIFLNTKNGYRGMRIEDCTLSSSATLPDHSATTLPIVTSGCPSSNQNILTSQNMFQRVNNQPNEWETGMVQLVKLRQGSTLHIHCRVKLCVQSNTESCSPHQCGAPSERRRRAIETEEDVSFVNLHGAVNFADAQQQNVMLGMSLSAIAFSIVIFLFIIIMVVYIVRQTRKVVAKKHIKTKLSLISTRQLFIKRFQKKDLPSHMTESKI